MPINALSASLGYGTGNIDANESLGVPIGPSAPEPGGQTFAAELTSLLTEVNRDQADAATKAIDLAVNGNGSIHDAMIAAEKAESSFRLLMEMRNRLIEGVNRLLETQI